MLQIHIYYWALFTKIKDFSTFEWYHKEYFKEKNEPTL